MSRPLDAPERRAAVHGSAEVSAAKHLARVHGLHMRRVRRVGPVRFTVGDAKLQFSDEGRLVAGLMHEELLYLPRLVELDTLMRAGWFTGPARTLAEVDTTIVLGDLPADAEPLTGPIPTTAATYDVLVLRLPEDTLSGDLPAQDSIPVETAALFLEAAPGPLGASLGTQSIPIIAPAVAMGPDQTPHTREIAIIEVRAEVASGVSLWSRFFFGVAVFVIAFVVGTLAATHPANVVWMGAVSVVLGIVAVWVIVSAIHENDQRLAALRTVGLR